MQPVQHLLRPGCKHVVHPCHLVRVFTNSCHDSDHLLRIFHHGRAFPSQVTLSVAHIRSVVWDGRPCDGVNMRPLPPLFCRPLSNSVASSVGETPAINITVATIQENVANTKTQLIARFLVATSKSIYLLFLLSSVSTQSSLFQLLSLFLSTSQAKSNHKGPSDCSLRTALRFGHERPICKSKQIQPGSTQPHDTLLKRSDSWKRN
jgi:hypothetical protein